jgi:hypothetical protein
LIARKERKVLNITKAATKLTLFVKRKKVLVTTAREGKLKQLFSSGSSEKGK